MKVFEKRGYAKTYDENGKLLTKTPVGEVLDTEEVEDLFGDE
jgi:antitoxin component YwqK of YwqJK toxin-antitoxin module